MNQPGAKVMQAARKHGPLSPRISVEELRKRKTLAKNELLTLKQAQFGVTLSKGLCGKATEAVLLELMHDAQRLRSSPDEKIGLIGIHTAAEPLGIASIIQELCDSKVIRSVTMKGNIKRIFTTMDVLKIDLKKPEVKEFILKRVKQNPQQVAYWKKRLERPPFI